MNHLRYFIVPFLMLFGSLNHVSAQTWAKTNETPANYFSIRKQFEDYWKDKVPEKGSGYKTYQRWLWHWKDRVELPEGNFPDARAVQAAWNTYAQAQPQLASPANWTSLGPNNSASGYNGVGRINCIAFSPTSTTTFWVGTPAGGLWKTTNSGASWTTNTDNLAALGVSAIVIDPTNSNIMYLGTGDADGQDAQSIGVLKSTNGGTSWSSTGLTWVAGNYKYIRQMAIHPSSTSTLLAATNDGLYRTTNGGTSWTKVVSGDFYDVKFKPGTPATIYAATENKLYRSTDTGASWSVSSTISGSSRLAISVSGANSSLVAAVSSSGTGAFNGLYSSTNSGVSYTLKSSTPNILNSSPTGSGTSGQGWYDLCISISPSNANTIYVGAVNLWKSTNGGTSWTLVTHWRGSDAPSGVPVVHADKHCLAWQNSTTLFKGCDGGIYKTSNGGTSWTDLSNTLVISQMYRLGVSQSDNKIICGLQDNGTKLRSTAGVWTDNIGGDGMECAIHPTNSNIMYGEYQNGQIHRSTNGGSSWTDIQDNISGQPDGAWVTPFMIDPNNSTTIYAGFNEVYKSINQGSAWTAISSNLSPGSKITGIAVAPSSSNTIYIYNQDNSVFRTTNGGSTWTNVTGSLPVSSANLTYITVSPSNSSLVYVTLGNYASGKKVYKSTNGGSTWTNISGTLPNLPANCINAQSSNEGLYVGMDVGIYYRDAGMSDWQLFNTGLPNVPVMELEIRNSTGKIRAATFGRGLWESNANTTSNTLSISPANRDVSAPAGSTTFTITATGAWTVSDNQSWLTVTPSSGTNNGSITANFSANTSSATRTATITVTAGSNTATATVTQAGVTNFLNVTPAQQDVPATAGSVTYTVSSNISWTAGDNQSWVTLSPANGTNNGTITATYAQNTSGAVREAIITVSGSNQAQTVILTQAANTSNCSNDNEPANNSISSAPFITFSNDKLSQIGSSSDVDYWKFSLSVNSVVILRLTDLPADYELYLIDASGNQIGASESAGNDNEYLEYGLIPGTYCAKVIGYNGAYNTSQCYKLRVAFSALGACSNGNEPGNNTTSTAPSISMNSYKLSLIGSSSDLDLWRFSTGGGSTYLDLFGLPADFDLELWDNSGSVVTGSYNSGNSSEFISYDLNGGTYYAAVFGYNGAYSSQCYVLEVSNSDWLYLQGNIPEERTEISAELVRPEDIYLVYPNPSQGLVNVRAPGVAGCEAVVYDIFGKEIIREQFQRQTQLDLSSYPAGCYLLHLEQNGVRTVRKLMLNPTQE
jgi:hypothetical protein